MTPRNRWQGFLDSLDTTGGHIVVLFTVLAVGLVTNCAAMEKYRAEVFGAFLLALRGGKRDTGGSQ